MLKWRFAKKHVPSTLILSRVLELQNVDEVRVARRYDAMQQCDARRRCDAAMRRGNATRCNAMQGDATQCKVMRRDATRCNARWRCNVTPCDARWRCNGMQWDAMQCDATRRDATQCDDGMRGGEATQCNDESPPLSFRAAITSGLNPTTAIEDAFPLLSSFPPMEQSSNE
jgi:hypothetical protein